jgi:hypothetical protein
MDDPMRKEDAEQRLVDSWCRCFARGMMNDAGLPDPDTVIRSCHVAHFRELDLENTLEAYVGKVGEFPSFLEEEWKWKVHYDRATNVITADENKDHCVCPLARRGVIESGKLCLCSEGFAQSLFSYVLQKEVTVKILRSWLRDGKSCVYEVSCAGPAT